MGAAGDVASHRYLDRWNPLPTPAAARSIQPVGASPHRPAWGPLRQTIHDMAGDPHRTDQSTPVPVRWRRCRSSRSSLARSPGSSFPRTTSPRRPGAGRTAPCRTTCSPIRSGRSAGARPSPKGRAGPSTAGSSGRRPSCTTHGLTRTARNTMCFEVEGAEIARRFLERQGLPADDADRVAIAIILHMQPSVTLHDGVEAVLLDRATSLDVRGDGYALVDRVRPSVMRDFPRRAFDRRFLDAIAREAAARPTCQSARLLHRTGLADWMARSPWAPRGRDVAWPAARPRPTNASSGSSVAPVRNRPSTTTDHSSPRGDADGRMGAIRE